jgi:cell division protein FtsZ
LNKTRKPQEAINEVETMSEEVSPCDLTISELQKKKEARTSQER